MGWSSFLKQYKEKNKNKKFSYNELLKNASKAYKRKKDSSFRKTLKKTKQKLREYEGENKKQEKLELKQIEQHESTEESNDKPYDLNTVSGLQNMLISWNDSLNRNENEHPCPYYPIHPISRKLIHPIEIYDTMKSVCIKNKMDNVIIEIPLTVNYFIKEPQQVIYFYNKFLENISDGSNELRNYFFSNGIKYVKKQWVISTLTKITEEEITEILYHVINKYPDQVENVINDIKNPVIKDPEINNIHSKIDLISKLKTNSKLFEKLTEFDCQYLNIDVDEYNKLKQILNEKNYKKELDNFFKVRENKLKKYAKGTVEEFFTGCKIIINFIIK